MWRRGARAYHLASFAAAGLALASINILLEAQEIPVASAAIAPLTTAGGTIRGTARAGTIPLPGVAITATNTLTGKKYATTTDINGIYEMTIPKTGRYVVRAELAAFAAGTNEVRLTADATQQTAAFTMQLASRAAQVEAAGDTTSLAGLASALGRGTQALSVTGDAAGLTDASTNGANAGAALPSLSGLGDSAANGTDEDQCDRSTVALPSESAIILPSSSMAKRS